MRLTIYSFSFLLSAFSFFISCKNDRTDEIVTPVHSAILQVTVLYDSSGTMKPLNNVTLYLFLTEADRDNNQNVKFTKTVNGSGQATFSQLPDDYYYILSSHPSRGFRQSQTATPNNSTSYEEIDY